MKKSLRRVVGFGDFLLRLMPPGYRRFGQTSSFNCYYTGAESNVCASLAVMGVPAAFVTRVPDNPIARTGLGELKRLDVDVSDVVFGGDRLGLYYLEKGASQRPSLVVYDRMHSGLTTARRRDFKWTSVLKGAGYFHVTGITPALGGELPAIVEDACRTARRLGVQVVCDLNYRSRLWTVAEAAATMPRIVRLADHLIANAWDAREILGVETDDDPARAAERMKKDYPRLKTVAMTFRTAASASDNMLSALLHADGKAYRSREYAIHVVDRVGGGDSFAAGLIYGLVHALKPQEMVEFATAASCLKHSIELDVNLSTVPEILRLMNGGEGGQVQR